MNQPHLMPPSLDELIDEHHLVRVVNQVIDKLDLKTVVGRYKGGGTSSYHPQMLLQVLVYAYTQKIYSLRRIARKVICWISLFENCWVQIAENCLVQLQEHLHVFPKDHLFCFFTDRERFDPVDISLQTIPSIWGV
jgi:hypothetical protein